MNLLYYLGLGCENVTPWQGLNGENFLFFYRLGLKLSDDKVNGHVKHDKTNNKLIVTLSKNNLDLGNFPSEKTMKNKYKDKIMLIFKRCLFSKYDVKFVSDKYVSFTKYQMIVSLK